MYLQRKKNLSAPSKTEKQSSWGTTRPRLGSKKNLTSAAIYGCASSRRLPSITEKENRRARVSYLQKQNARHVTALHKTTSASPTRPPPGARVLRKKSALTEVKKLKRGAHSVRPWGSGQQQQRQRRHRERGRAQRRTITRWSTARVETRHRHRRRRRSSTPGSQVRHSLLLPCLLSRASSQILHC